MANEERELSVSAQCKLGGWDSLRGISSKYVSSTGGNDYSDFQNSHYIYFWKIYIRSRRSCIHSLSPFLYIEWCWVFQDSVIPISDIFIYALFCSLLQTTLLRWVSLRSTRGKKVGKKPELITLENSRRLATPLLVCPRNESLRNERSISMLMTRHYPDLNSASEWSCHEGNLLQPIRSTIQIWVVTRNQCHFSDFILRENHC